MRQSTRMSFTVAKTRSTKVAVEFDARTFERIAATFGFISDECTKSLARAERNVRSGKIREIGKGKGLLEK